MNEHIYTVYIHKSPSDKVYVGITHLKPENRWRNGLGYTSKHFTSAIRKYGWDNFQHIIVADKLTKKQAEFLEVVLINYYDATNPEYGYNCSIGGEKGALGCTYTRGHFSDKHKKALSDAWKKRKERGLGEPWNKGLKLKETGMIDNFLKAGLNNIESKKRPIQMIDKTTGTVLNEFCSVSEAAKFLNKHYISSIIETASGKRKSAFGYFWKYIEKTEDKNEE